MRNSYEVRAQKFIQQIAPYLEKVIDHDDREYAVNLFNLDHNRRVSYAHGMTRYALITSDYVVKVDYAITRWGNSEDEMEIYKEAVEDGFDYLFAKISRYDYNGTSYYIMPRIHGVSTAGCFAWEFMTAEEEAWCKEIGLSDLHEDNYGFRNGHVCLIDYACHFGYEDYESSYDFYSSEEEC